MLFVPLPRRFYSITDQCLYICMLFQSKLAAPHTFCSDQLLSMIKHNVGLNLLVISSETCVF